MVPPPSENPAPLDRPASGEPARRFPCPDAELAPEHLATALATLAAGRLIALPTETVYGLVARADSSAALAALDALKGRPLRGALTWHVAGVDALAELTQLRPLAERLARRYWPGPLTLVVPLVPAGLEGAARDGRLGLRAPAHAGFQSIVRAADFPLVATSANRHGAAPLLDADAVAAEFGHEPEAGLALIGDGGPSRMGEASGVLAIEPGRFKLLREGLLPLSDLRRTAGLKIAFVCTGNTCRSPMAEGLARELLAERLGTTELEQFGFDVQSMGVFAGPGAPASGHAVDELRERGIDLSSHASQAAIPERIAEFDRVYCLTRGHAQALIAMLPPGRAGQVELLDPGGSDVPDPVGGSRADYAACASAIENMVQARAADWA